MAEGFELDIDRERVCLDGEWLTVADLTARIKEKVEAGDYRVSKLSRGLELLEETLSAIQTLMLKVPPDLVDTYQRIADFEEKPIASVLRRALMHYAASEDAAQRLFEARRAEERRQARQREATAE